ncbi:MAG: dihydroorotate dehydrogenase [Bacillota bacterium]
MFNPNLCVNLGGIELNSPVLAASGPFGYGHEYHEYLDLDALGGIIVKGVSLKPWEGNPPPRLAETASGLLNSIGLQNPGLLNFLENDLPLLRNTGPRLIVNIVGATIEEYAAVAEGLTNAEGVDGLEVNVSCPNLKAGGMAFCTDPGVTYAVVSAVRKKTALPLLVKLSPNVTDIKTIASAAEAAGADALSLINTLSGMLIDIESRKPVLGNIFGGLSGPAVMPVALKMTWQTADAVKIPLLGMGGITSAEDALQFIMAGARAVAVGTGLFYNPGLPFEILKGLKQYMMINNIADLGILEGAARKGEV